jgi:hypothetical protein
VFPRFVTLLGADTRLDVGAEGWRSFVHTVKIRNRITHPKSSDDLALSLDETIIAAKAVNWYLDLIQTVMTSVTTTFDEVNAIMRPTEADVAAPKEPYSETA